MKTSQNAPAPKGWRYLLLCFCLVTFAASAQVQVAMDSTKHQIPVVFHYFGSDLTFQQVKDIAESLLVHIGEIFENDTDYYHPDGNTVELYPCFAQRDPNGNATIGIKQYPNANSDIDSYTKDLDLKSTFGWNPWQYLNIYIVNSTSWVNGDAYATYPDNHGLPRDGIVMEKRFFTGDPNDAKLLAHELGHYFGLLHTYEGGCYADSVCNQAGDGFCSTPAESNVAIVPCTQAPLNFCGVATLKRNYMGKLNILCRMFFSGEQVDSMVAVAETIRASLLVSPGCCPPGFGEFTMMDNHSATIQDGGDMTFGDTLVLTTAAPPNGATIQWFVNGNQVTATGDSASYTPTHSGIHTVKLVIMDTVSGCMSIHEQTVNVNCPFQAAWGPNRVSFYENEPIVFTNHTGGNTKAIWTINGQMYCANTTQPILLPKGEYQVMLQVLDSSTACKDTASWWIFVGTCADMRYDTWVFANKCMAKFAKGASPAFNMISQPVPIDRRMNYSVISLPRLNSSVRDVYFAGTKSVWRVGSTNRIYKNPSTSVNEGIYQPSILLPNPGSPQSFFAIMANDSMTVGEIDPNMISSWRPTFIRTGISSRLSAVRHCNTEDYWVVVSDQTGIYAYLLDSQGFNTNAVTSVYSFGSNSSTTRDYLKCSPDGTLMAISSRIEKKIYLFAFDTFTGKAEYLSDITMPNAGNSGGLEFSPSGNFLYFTEYKNSTDETYQVDVSNPSDPGTPLRIAARTGLSNSSYAILSLTLAIDGKIYAAARGDDHLSMIELPEKTGLDAMYGQVSHQLPNALMTRSGLANVPASAVYDGKPHIHGKHVFCKGESPVFWVGGCPGTVTWTLDGQAQGTVNTNVLSLSPLSVGSHRLVATLTTPCSIRRDTLDFRVENVELALPSTDTMCQGIDLDLNAGSGFASYIWSNGSDNSSITVTAAGTYAVTVTTASGCTDSASVIVEVDLTGPIPTMLPSARTICPGEIINFTSNSGFDYVFWQELNRKSHTVTITEPGTYHVELHDSFPCLRKVIHTITVYDSSPAAISIPDVTDCDPASRTRCIDSSANKAIYWVGENGFSYMGSCFNIPVSATQVTWEVWVIDSTTGCTARDTFTADACVARPESAAGASLEIFPNPNQGSFSIMGTLPPGYHIVSIHNAIGIRVAHKACLFRKQGDRTRAELDLSSLPSGMYFCSLRTQQGLQFTGRMVISRE